MPNVYRDVTQLGQPQLTSIGSKVVKERNLTRAQYMSSRYYSRKFGPLETVYVSGADKLYKTTRYAILALKPE